MKYINGDKIRMIATRNYKDRITKGKIYNGVINTGSVEFTCNQGIKNTCVNLSSLLDESWFKVNRELHKNIRVL